MGHDPKERFTETVGNYAKHRPTYPASMVEWILSRLARAPQRVVDLACGTGILAEVARKSGLDPLGIEPNEAMVLEASQAAGAWARGAAEHLPLRDRSVDLVLCGQAFHWFDLDLALAELDRVLASGGRVAACWNLRDNDRGIGAAYHQAMIHHSSEYSGEHRYFDTLADALSDREFETWSVPSDQVVSLETLLGRARSASYVAHGVSDLAALDADLTNAFHEYATDDVVHFPYSTRVYLWGHLGPTSARGGK